MQIGKLVVVGDGTQKFFAYYQFHLVNDWIIDQLTLSPAKVVVWLAKQQPFRDEVKKIKILSQY